MSQHKVKIGAVQSRCSADLDANLAAAERGIRKAVAAGAQIVCLQELFRSLYFCQVENHKYFELAEPVPGPTTDKMQALAKELGIVIVASLFERRAPGIYHNTAAIIDADGTYLGKYRKMHIPDDPLYYEKFYFTPGDLGFAAWDTKFARIGVYVCWDQWYPEAARLTVLRGARILFYPTAIGWHPDEKAEYGRRQHSSWETVQRGHAIANGCHETAKQAKANGKDAGQALSKAGAALDGAAKWSGTKLKEGAQASVDALKKAARKTGEGVKAGTKQVEAWLKDIGNGIKEVGRKL